MQQVFYNPKTMQIEAVTSGGKVAGDKWIADGAVEASAEDSLVLSRDYYVTEIRDGRVLAVASRVNPFQPAPKVPASITPRQMLLGLMAQGFITEQEALDAAQKGAVPASVQAIFDALPTSAERVAAAITWAKMSVVERDHELVAALATANRMNEQDVDAFFIACSKI